MGPQPSLPKYLPYFASIVVFFQRNSGTQVIKRIELINFMSHRHTVIEPADGLTVLIGPNNCGKSAFVTALQILCHNSKSGFVLRHGEKKCEVIVETADGHVINWSRKKNGSGIYVVDGEPFDRLRGSVPPEVHAILKMPKVKCDNEEFDVHFGEQSEPVFLLRDRGKASAQFFASSSDATHLVAMQSLHKSKVLVHKRDFKQLTRQHKSLTEQLKSLDPVDDLETRLVATEKQFADLQTEAATLGQCERLISKIKSAQTTFDRFKAQATSLQSLVNPPEVTDERPLANLTSKIGSAQTTFDRFKTQATSLESLVNPPETADERPLGNLIASITWTAAKGVVCDAVAGAFGELSTAPPLKPADSLESLLQRIKTKQLIARQSKKFAKAFAALTPEPVLPDAAALQQLVQKLQDRHRSSRVAENMLAAVKKVPAMPKQTDVANLTQMLDLIGAKQRQLKTKADQCEQTAKELVGLQSEFESWVDDNPVCPTCGSQTDAQHVLQQHDRSQVETPRGSRG